MAHHIQHDEKVAKVKGPANAPEQLSKKIKDSTAKARDFKNPVQEIKHSLSQKSEKAQFEVILAEIEKPSNKDNKREKQQIYYELPYFDENAGGEHYVNFNKAHTVKLCLLDLCVYQPDGSAVISKDQRCPDIVIPTWKKYFSYLKRDFEKIITRYQDLQKLLEKSGEKKEILSMVLPKSSNSKKALFKGDIRLKKDEASICFNFRRVGRLCQPKAGEMLMQYARKMSRMAFDHDFARNTVD